ncbi:MAG: 5-formyltetrahydrofolate cyclo-ligase [Firmicutes bacterium]|nr:5-formyltetrahydrofolate cyclo-ligase [Bacillota bacterium]
MNPEERKALRKSKIAARDALSPEERKVLSEDIVSKIVESPEFKEAKTVLIYRATRGEVRLEALETAPEAEGKRLLFPLCLTNSEMIALLPDGPDAWQEGYYGIWEPIREKSQEIAPEKIDLVICPCTVFDDKCGRMGMGAGFYDRYLEKCVNAHVVSVAFEVQKADEIPMAPWDKPMEKTFTEKTVYCSEIK